MNKIDYDTIGKTADMLINAIELPEAKSADEKEFIKIFKQYGLVGIDRWLTVDQLAMFLKRFKTEWDYRFNKYSIMEKDKGAEDIKRLQADAEKVKDLMPAFIKGLKIRLEALKKENKDDFDLLSKNKDVTWVEDSSKVKHLEDQASNLFRVEKSEKTFPGPESADAHKFLKLLQAYGLTHDPNPNGWMVPSDFLVMTRALKHLIVNRIKAETTDGKRPEGMKAKEWEAEKAKITSDYQADLKAFDDLVPLFIEDFKVRAEKYAKTSELDFANLKDHDWINDGSLKVLKEDIKKELAADIVKDKKLFQPGWNMIEETKYDALEGYIGSYKTGFKALGDKLARTVKNFGLLPWSVKNPRETIEWETVLGSYEKHINEAQSKLKDSKELNEESKKFFNDSIKKYDAMKANVKTLLSTHYKIPGEEIARSLSSFCDFFNEMYGSLISYAWFRDKYSSEDEEISYDKLVLTEDFNFEDLVLSAKGDVAVKSIQELELDGKAIVDDLQHECTHLSGLPLKAKTGIKGGIKMVKKMVGEFFKVTGLISNEAEGQLGQERQKQPEVAKTAIGVLEPKEKAAPTETHQEFRERSLIPENYLHEGRQIIEKIKHNTDKKLSAMAPIAQKEFDQLVDTLKETYRKGFTDKEISDLAKEKKITPEKAAIQLQSHKDALNKAAFEAFSLAWTDILKHSEEGMPLKTKEKSEQGNRHHKNYEQLHATLEHLKGRFPILRQLAPDPAMPTEPTRGMPSPAALHNYIEELWKKHEDPSNAEMARLWKIEMTEAGFANGFPEQKSHGGGGGGAGKSRPKPVKIPPASGVKEQMEKLITRQIKTKSAEEIVNGVIGLQLLNIQKHLGTLKEDEIVLEGDLVDTLVTELKNLHSFMMAMKIGPSSDQVNPSKMQKPKYPGKGDNAGPFKYNGTPDISIDDWKEAKKVFDQYLAIFNVINHFIKPDKISTPPEKSNKPDYKYLPSG
jgi:hypothetical protein